MTCEQKLDYLISKIENNDYNVIEAYSKITTVLTIVLENQTKIDYNSGLYDKITALAIDINSLRLSIDPVSTSTSPDSTGFISDIQAIKTFLGLA